MGRDGSHNWQYMLRWVPVSLGDVIYRLNIQDAERYIHYFTRYSGVKRPLVGY